MRFLRYLKKHKLLCVGLIVLMLASSFCDFLSPYVTSDVVNIGIQQRGIEYGVPYAMDDQTKNEIETLISTNEEIQYFNNAYTSNNNLFELNEKEVDKQQLSNTTEPIMAYLYNCDENKISPTETNFNAFKNNTDSSTIKKNSINYTIKLNEQFNVNQIKICLDYLFVQASILLAVFFAALLLCVLRSICSALIALKIGKEKRLQIYDSILKLNSKQIDYFTRSSLITRSTTDIQVVQTMCLMILNQLVGAPLGAIVGIIFAIKTAPSLLWIILLGIVLIIIAATIVYIWAKPKFMILQTILDKVAANTRRIINGSLVYRAFNRQQLEYDNFYEANQALYKRKKFVYQLIAIINPLLGLGYGGMTLLIVFFGSLDVQSGLIQTGQIIAFISYANMVVGSFVSVGMLIGSLPSTTVSANRIDEVIDMAKNNVEQTNNDADNDNKNKSVNFENYDISFNNVSFKYDGSSAENIKQASFQIPQGSTVAIIGVTGSGKSTLCKLMLNLYDCDKGEISIGGCNFSQFKPQQIRQLFSYAGQDSFLFSKTIKENIIFGDENCSNKKLNAVTNNACLNNMINSQPDGVNYKIQQKSKNISGGQKQRISIARALAKDSQIYIFDDCFSAVDYSTEAQLLNNIKKSTKGKTQIFVTQKISTAKNADQILVLDNGQLVGVGNHKHLINNCSEYIEICNSQNEKI